MKKTTKIFTGILCLLLLFAVPLHTQAASSTFVKDYCVEDTFVKIICTDIEVSGDAASLGTFRLTVQGQEIAIQNVTTVKAEAIPTTYYCLVDVSGSMRQAQMDQMKAILHQVNESVQSGDNMIIASLGNQVSSSGYLESTEDRKAAIDALAAGNEDTNLYAGIAEGLNFLKTDINVHPQKCLLVFSDGQDDQKSGITKEEAERAVQESGISIITVATLRESPTDSQIEYGKLLGSFARMSIGGSHYAPVIDGMNLMDIGTAIVAAMQNSAVLMIDTSSLKANGGLVPLKVSYTAGSTVLEDVLEVDSALLPVVEETVPENTDAPINESVREDNDSQVTSDVVATRTPEAQEPSAPEIPSEDASALVEEKEETKVNLRIWIAVAVGVLLLAVLVVMLVILKMKKSQKSKRAGISYGNVEDEAKTTVGNECEVQFVLADTGELQNTLYLEEGRELVIGRNQYADFKLNLEDKKISGNHCKVRCQNGSLFVEDMDSTNGTYVNSRNIANQGAVRVDSGDRVKIGHYVYIVRY